MPSVHLIFCKVAAYLIGKHRNQRSRPYRPTTRCRRIHAVLSCRPKAKVSMTVCGCSYQGDRCGDRNSPLTGLVVAGGGRLPSSLGICIGAFLDVYRTLPNTAMCLCRLDGSKWLEVMKRQTCRASPFSQAAGLLWKLSKPRHVLMARYSSLPFGHTCLYGVRNAL